jgi:integrase
VLGSQPVREVTEHELRSLLRGVVSRGVNRMAVNLSRDLKQMFDWAEKRQPWRRLLQEGNPTDLIEIDRIVAADYDMSNVRRRVLSPGEIRELKAIFERTQADYDAAPDKRRATRAVQAETRLALWICLSTCCRIGELLLTEWRHVDLSAATWFIPKENVKGSRGKQQDQLVFLSAFALEQFKALHQRTGKTSWCFPSRDATDHVCVKSVSKQVGDRQLRFKNRKDLQNRTNDDTLVLSGGSAGEWTPHDLRRTAATMMQALGVSPDVIDRCQNHVLAGSRVRRHYLQHEYADEKRAAWRLLGDEIEKILGAATPVSAPSPPAVHRPLKSRAVRHTTSAAPSPRERASRPGAPG